MKKVILIGKMNDMMKDLNAFLGKFFRLQLCTENTQNALGMIKVVEPDLILISLVGRFDIDNVLFERISRDFPDIPVITIGTENEKKEFLGFYNGGQFENLIRPIDNSDVFSAICNRLSLSENRVLEEAVQSEEDGRKRVLVVDDSAASLRSIKAMLDKKYNVTLVNSGMKALTSIGKSRPDVILLDYEMPVCDGRQTLEMIQAEEELNTIPVIFLTGVNDRAHIQAVLKLKPAGYLLKPADPEKLISTIEEAIKC